MTDEPDRPPAGASPAPDPVRPPSPFAEWADPPPPTPPPPAGPPPTPPPPAGPPPTPPRPAGPPPTPAPPAGWQPTPAPPAAPAPAIRPPQPGPPLRQPGPQPQPGWVPAAGAYGAPLYQQPPPFQPPPPVFPPAPPGLYPTPDDPLVSADFNGWWSKSFRLLKAVWRHAALVQLLWMFPVAVTGALAASVLSETFRGLQSAPDDFQPDWHPFLRSLYYLVPLGLMTVLLYVLASLATLHLVLQAALGRPLSVGLALRSGGPRVPAYVGWGLLGFLLTLLGFVCCILPGYYVRMVVMILPTVVLLERGGALGRCFRLFHARLGDALARLFTMIGVGMVISFAGQVFIGILGTPFDLVSGDGISWAATFSLSAAVLVLYGFAEVVLAPMNVTAYADMRARHEPFSTAYLTA